MAITKNLINKAVKSFNKPKKEPKNREKLSIKRDNITWGHNRFSNVLEAIRFLTDHQWSTLPAQLKPEFRDHIEKYRKATPKLVTMGQLYALMSASTVDQQVYNLCKQGRLIQINTGLPKPAILVLRSEDYALGADGEALVKLKELVQKSRVSVLRKSLLNDAFTEIEVQRLIELKYLAIVPRDPDSLKLTSPNIGLVIKLLQNSQTWILRKLKATKWKELDEDELRSKWRIDKSLYKDFKGVQLDWCLYFLIGEGLVACFESIDKRALRLM